MNHPILPSSFLGSQRSLLNKLFADVNPAAPHAALVPPTSPLPPSLPLLSTAVSPPLPPLTTTTTVTPLSPTLLTTMTPTPLSPTQQPPLPPLAFGNYICFILTCQKPVYTRRHQYQKATVELLLRRGFQVFYLLGNGIAQQGPIVIPNYCHGVPALQVPGEETYENLTHRMATVFSLFLDYPGLRGVLKIDDDTTIVSEVLLDEIVAQPHVDYMGGNWNVRTTVSDRYHQHRCTYSPWNRTATDFPTGFTWFGGPCYYVSARALGAIRAYGLRTVLEDVSVGEAVQADPTMITIDTNWEARGLVRWTTDPGILEAPKRKLLTCMLTGGLGRRLFSVAIAMEVAAQWGWQVAFCPTHTHTNPNRPDQHTAVHGLAALFPTIPLVMDTPDWPVAQNIEAPPVVASQGCVAAFTATVPTTFNHILMPLLPVPRACYATGLPNALHWFVHIRSTAPQWLPYYTTALQRLHVNFPSAPLYLFSDHSFKAQIFLRKALRKAMLPNIQVISLDGIDTDILWYMAQCTGGVCAPGSALGWWGAFLGMRRAAPAPTYFYMATTTIRPVPAWAHTVCEQTV